MLNSKEVKEVTRRNVLTSGIVSTYPFISSSICDENGIPKSKIVLNCLRKNNFSEDREGVRAAIRKGFLAVMKDINHETCLIEGQEGVEFFDEQDSKVSEASTTSILCHLAYWLPLGEDIPPMNSP